MDSILEYHISQTDKNFDEVKEELQSLNLKMAELQEFKIRMIASSRTISFIVSAISGFITMVATLYANHKLK